MLLHLAQQSPSIGDQTLSQTPHLSSKCSRARRALKSELPVYPLSRSHCGLMLLPLQMRYPSSKHSMTERRRQMRYRLPQQASWWRPLSDYLSGRDLEQNLFRKRQLRSKHSTTETQ